MIVPGSCLPLPFKMIPPVSGPCNYWVESDLASWIPSMETIYDIPSYWTTSGTLGIHTNVPPGWQTDYSNDRVKIEPASLLEINNVTEIRVSYWLSDNGTGTGAIGDITFGSDGAYWDEQYLPAGLYERSLAINGNLDGLNRMLTISTGTYPSVRITKIEFYISC